MTTMVRIEIAVHPILVSIVDEYQGSIQRQDKIYLPGDALPFLYSTTTRSIMVVDLEPDDARVQIEHEKRSAETTTQLL